MRFTQTLHLTRKPQEGLVCLSIATSENRVDEITIEEHEFKRVVAALWDRSPEYQGGLVLRGKFKDGHFSLSLKNGAYTRTIYRLEENTVVPVLGKYLAETGGE
jgi:hypothetical protein